MGLPFLKSKRFVLQPWKVGVRGIRSAPRPSRKQYSIKKFFVKRVLTPFFDKMERICCGKISFLKSRF